MPRPQAARCVSRICRKGCSPSPASAKWTGCCSAGWAARPRRPPVRERSRHVSAVSVWRGRRRLRRVLRLRLLIFLAGFLEQLLLLLLFAGRAPARHLELASLQVGVAY